MPGEDYEELVKRIDELEKEVTLRYLDLGTFPPYEPGVDDTFGL